MFPSKDGGVGGCGGIRLFDWNGKKRRQEELLRQREEAREKEEAERRWREKCEAAKVLQQAIIVWGHFYRARDTTPPFKVSETSRELLWRQAPNYGRALSLARNPRRVLTVTLSPVSLLLYASATSWFGTTTTNGLVWPNLAILSSRSSVLLFSPVSTS